MTFNQPNDRRDFVKTLGASVAASTVSGFLFNTSAAIAQTNQEIITRKIPRTGESLPAIGLGTYLTVDLLPGAPRNHIPEVIKRFWENGARVFDTSPLYGSEEISVGDFASSMAINEQMFICNKICQLVNSYPTTATPNVVSNRVSKDSGEIRSISCR